MSDTVIRVENLGKKYILGHQSKERYTTLRDSIATGAKGLLKPFQRDKSASADSSSEDFWALKDVSFEIKQGDRVGIVGRNGAGKSTLLKILSRITEPTQGSIRIKGRVASLLEVGTGFHPELTGRENISLNGAILGMSKVEIARKFDEIVEFAEVEKFLDTPVKRYSSGMYVRLAFSVAAHLEPEILIVDEVLAVGDAQFQKKCLGKMEDVGKEGRTVLFVSHNMATVTTLCQRGIWLINGSVNLDASAELVTSKYLTYGVENSGEVVLKPASQSQQFWFNKISLIDAKDRVSSNFDIREPIKICLEYELAQITNNLEIGFKIINSFGITIFTVNRSLSLSSELAVGNYHAEIEIPRLFLSPGSYTINIAAHIPNVEILCLHQSIVSFEVEETGSKMSKYKGLDIGAVLIDLPWEESVSSSKKSINKTINEYYK
jgi:lipopolysaccharide transport system ATP-binding protein